MFRDIAGHENLTEAIIDGAIRVHEKRISSVLLSPFSFSVSTT